MRLSRTALLAVLTLLLAAGLAPAQRLQETLPNGLRVVLERYPAAPIAAVRFFVGVGSAWEGKHLGAGLSHLVEHAASHGSAQYTEDQIQEARSFLGPDTNAFTNKDTTWYVYTVPADQVERAVALMADYVLAPTLSPELIEQEQQVILRELAQDEDVPNVVAWEFFSSIFYLQHPRRYPIAGFRDSLSALTAADAQVFHQATYAPDNVVLSVVGDIDPARLLARLREILAVYPARARQLPVLPPEPPLLSAREAVREQPGLQRAHLRLAWRSVSLFSEDMYPLDLLAMILGQGDSSRLVARLKYRDAVVDEVWCGDDTPPYDAGVFVMGAICDPARVEEAKAALLREVRLVRERGVSRAELDRARQQLRASKVFDEQTAAGRADDLGRNLLVAGDSDFTRRYLEKMAAVTPGQVQAAARKYLDPEVYVLAVVRPPLPGPVKPERGERAAAVSTLRLTLPNGLRLLAIHRPGSGVVSLLTATRAGLRLDPPGKAGLSQFAGEMLTRGAGRLSREEIARRLEDRGARLSAYSGRNSVGLSGQALREDADLLAATLADCLRRPSFPPEETEGLRGETLAAIAARQENPYSVTSELLTGLLFPKHPYRWPQNGTEESVKSFTRADLVAFHQAVFSPAGTVLVVSGELKPDEARALADKYFGDWRAAGKPPAPVPPDPPPAERLAREVDRTQAQVVLYYGWSGPRVTDENLPIWEVLFGYLGDHTQGPIFLPLRRAGLVYGAGAYFIPGLDPGMGVFWAGALPGKAAPVREKLEEALRGVQEAPPSAEVLEKVKRRLVTGQALSLADPGDRAQTQALDELYGLGYDYHAKYAERINAVTPAQVQALARSALPLDRCVVVETRPKAQE